MSIHIQIKLFASLSQYEPEAPERHPIAPKTSVSDMLEHLGAPCDEAKLIFVNNRRGKLSTILKDGDRVGIFPPVGGG